jgi:hypothetical protein
MKAIPTPWFKHLPPEEQEEFKLSLRANHRVLSRLKALVLEDLRIIEDNEDRDDYYSEGYPYKQAFHNGERKGLKHILNYLSFLEE